MIQYILAFINRNPKKPLNVQIEEMRDYVSGYVLKASDDIYLESNNEEISSSAGTTADVPYQFKILNTSGTVRVAAAFTGTTATASYGTMYVYKNGTLMDTQTVRSTRALASDIEVTEGDIITAKFKPNATSFTMTADTFNICATPKAKAETGLIELIEG